MHYWFPIDQFLTRLLVAKKRGEIWDKNPVSHFANKVALGGFAAKKRTVHLHVGLFWISARPSLAGKFKRIVLTLLEETNEAITPYLIYRVFVKLVTLTLSFWHVRHNQFFLSLSFIILKFVLILRFTSHSIVKYFCDQ